MTAQLLGSFDPDFDRALTQTHEGQAHLAGSGPAGRTCRECLLWAFDGYHATGGLNRVAGALKPATCGKYRELMRRAGKAIPHHAKACRHFQENPQPPKVSQ